MDPMAGDAYHTHLCMLALPPVEILLVAVFGFAAGPEVLGGSSWVCLVKIKPQVSNSFHALVLVRVGILSALIPAPGMAGAAYLSCSGRGQPPGLDNSGDLKTGDRLNVVAPWPVTGLTADTHLHKRLLLRTYSGGVAPGTFLKPYSLGRIVGEIGLPLPGGDVVLGGKNHEIPSLLFHILLLPLAAQGVVHLFLAKFPDVAGCLKIADNCRRVCLCILHHIGVKGCLPLEIGPFVTLLARLGAHKRSTGPVTEFALKPDLLVGQFPFKGNGCHNDDRQCEGENSANNQWYFRNFFHP